MDLAGAHVDAHIRERLNAAEGLINAGRPRDFGAAVARLERAVPIGRYWRGCFCSHRLNDHHAVGTNRFARRVGNGAAS
jgi:hypothetical protein